MSRPKVELSNYPAVYEFYREHEQSPHATRFLHGVLGLVFRPRVEFAPGAKEKISEILCAGRIVVLAPNHISGFDPCVVAALPSREKIFKSLVGKTFSLSKSSVLKNPIVRPIVDVLDPLPVFRKEDLREGEDPRLLHGATEELLETSVAKMHARQSPLIFGEGKRNRGDTTRIQKIQRGIGLMVCGVTEIEQPPIIPIGIQYSEAKYQIPFPSVWIGEPSPDPFNKARDAREWLSEHLQNAVDNAVENLPS